MLMMNSGKSSIRRAAMLIALLAPVLLSMAGCAGYQVGNQGLFPQNIRTVNVQIFESDSFRPHLGERLTEAVVKRIEQETPYKVVGSWQDADSMLTGRILHDAKHVTAESPYDDPRAMETSFHVEVTWTNRSLGAVQPSQTLALEADMDPIPIDGESLLVPEVGQSSVTSQQRAIDRIARQIVGMLENPW
jgi:hypothetical protein